MSIKSIALASAALFALSAGISVAQADEQDDEVRQLNVEQLEKARNQSDTTTTTAPEPTMKPDGQGGPELQGPPSPDEGMDDDDTADEPATSDEPSTEDVPQGPEDDDTGEPE
jgi:hypothetical protein